MAYCIKCGKEIEDGNKYCQEHAPENSNAQQIMPNVCFVAGEKQKEVDFTVSATGAVAAQFGGAPSQENATVLVDDKFDSPAQGAYMPPVQNVYVPPVQDTAAAPAPAKANIMDSLKKSPLWMLPVGALVAIIGSVIFSAIGSAILNALVYNITFLDTDFLRYIFNGQVIPTIIFFVLSFGSLILYNKNCKKNGLEDLQFPIWYGGLFYVCRVAGSLVAGLLNAVVMFILSIVGEVTWLSFAAYEAYNVISVITGILSAILCVVATFFIFSFIQKKGDKK